MWKRKLGASYFAGLERNRSRSLVLIEIERFFEEVCVMSVECVPETTH
jgi:hypothetical protein